MANAFKSLITHPSAVGSDIGGEATRAMPSGDF
jgi:hypothetical protein